MKRAIWQLKPALARIALGALATLFCSLPVFALNPSLEINQYAHTSWTARDGLFKGYVTAIEQTPDGYLWLGTEFGLLRFDGVRTVPWQPPEGTRLRSNRICSLLAARDGTLWIGTFEELVSWKDGKLTPRPEFDGRAVVRIYEDRERAIWAIGQNTSENAKLCAFHGVQSECFGKDGSFGTYVSAIYEDGAGALWIASSKGLWRWRPGAPKLYPMEASATRLDGITEGDDGTMWMATRGGIRRLVGDKPVEYPLLGRRQFRGTSLFRDRDGGLWIGTVDRGLLHYYQGKTDSFGRSDGLSNDNVTRVFEDREGSLWVTTNGGLDRFREFAVPRFNVKQGLSSDSIGAVLAARDGSLWLASLNGLNRWKNGKITVYRDRSWSREGGAPDSNQILDRGLPSSSFQSLLEDSLARIWVSTPAGLAAFEDGHFVRGSDAPRNVVEILGNGPDSFWISDYFEGLLHLVQGRVAQRIPWNEINYNKGFATGLVRDLQGGLWIGFFRGGVVYFQDGKVRRTMDTPRVDSLRIDSKGVLWAATAAGLSRIGKDGSGKDRMDTMTSRNGLPCDSVGSMIEDDDHALWLSMACGIVRIAGSDLDAWTKDPSSKINVLALDESDGAVAHERSGGATPFAAKTADEKLWFAVFDGVSMVDPHHLPLNRLPPPVHIEQISADHKLISDRRLPAGTRDLQIDYTALSLVAPEKNRFKYKLEGYDRDWQDAGNRRQAFYTNLAARSYRFRVIASNNSGVWNEAGDTVEFSIAPAYYQTNWFRASMLAAFLLALRAAYRLRLHQLEREFNAHVEGQVDERVRVARDLHDTLLQSFQGLIPVFQTARNLLPGRADRAAQVLDEGLHDAADAIVEGRNAIQNLRADRSLDPDLGTLLTAAGEELAQSPEAAASSPAFRVVVEGPRRPLAPLLRDEIYRIGCEVLRNAFRHAHADRIEAEIRYDRGMFRLRIRDDGKGIDSSVLREGVRTGHWGLPGMHERAKSIGGRLKIWSEPGAGTEVELTVPARIAYAKVTRIGRVLRPFAPNKKRERGAAAGLDESQ